MTKDVGTHLDLLRKCVVGGVAEARRVADQAIARGDTAPATLRRAAWLAVADGETASGEAFLKQAASHPDDRGKSWFALGLLQLAQEDHDGARDAFLKAVRTCFTPRSAPAEAAICLWDPSTNRYAIIEVFYSDFQHAFCCFPILRKVSPIDNQCYEYCMARACNYLRSSPALAEMLELDRQLNGATFWYHVNMGHHHWLHNQRDSADPHFRQARKIAVRTGLRPYHFNCGTMVWLPRHETEALHAGRGPLYPPMSAPDWRYQFYGGPDLRVDMVIVVGCDRRYFQYFPNFLLSAIKAQGKSDAGPRIAVHCHVADPQQDQTDFLEQCMGDLNHPPCMLQLSYSPGPAQFNDPSYYTCLQFLALPDIMAFYRCGVLVMDIDATVSAGFANFCPHIGTFDFGLRMFSFARDSNRQVAGQPWSIGAHLTYVSDTLIGRQFARFLGDYILAAYDPKLPTTWTIDQCAIAQGYDLMLRDRPEHKVLNFAFYDQLSHLPQEYGGREQFLLAGGSITPANFREAAGPYTRR